MWGKNKVFDLLSKVLFAIFGLVIIYFFISNDLVTDKGIILKNDYIDQHIPFYEEFYRMLSNGMPFWSWNSFLGSDFWSSKVYYLVGDIYAWIGFVLFGKLNNVVRVLNRLLYLKFFIGYLGFYLFQLKIKNSKMSSFIFSLFYVFMGWNTTFMEHPSFTSLFSIIPFLLIGVERFLQDRKIFLFSISVFLLVSMNFYLFWIVCFLLLIYWITRYIVFYDNFNIFQFFKDSFILLFYFLLGLALSSIFIIPGVLHILQNQRIGSYLIEYDSWSPLNIASFIMFTMVPRLAYFNTGVFKDAWYYFEQISIYFGLLPLMLLPHTFYIFDKKKERITYSLLVIMLPILLISPKIGLFFHFTYSVRYTLLISILGLFIASLVFNKITKIKLSIVILTQLAISILYLLVIQYFIPIVYPEVLPNVLYELDLFLFAHNLSFLYTASLITYLLISKIKTTFNIKVIANFLILGLAMYELFVINPYVLRSQRYEEEYYPEYYNYTDFQLAVNYIKNLDSTFYRVEHNGLSFTWFRLENVSLVDDFHSTVTYDSVYQYSLSDFLRYYKQYPAVSWHFRFTEPSFFNLLNAKYAIIDTTANTSMVDLYYAEPITDAKFGNFQIYEYRDINYSARTYNSVKPISDLDLFVEGDVYNIFEVADLMKRNIYVEDSLIEEIGILNENSETLTFNTSDFGQNYINYNMYLNSKSVVYFSIPYDKGWKIVDNNQSNIEYFSVQGGFIGVVLEEGKHNLHFDFIPVGFELGKKLSLGSGAILMVLYLINVISTHISRKKSA